MTKHSLIISKVRYYNKGNIFKFLVFVLSLIMWLFGTNLYNHILSVKYNNY